VDTKWLAQANDRLYKLRDETGSSSAAASFSTAASWAGRRCVTLLDTFSPNGSSREGSPPMRVRRLAALTAALPLLALSGCGGDNPKPKPLDPPSTSASPSPTATTTPQADTPEEVIRKFVAAQNQIQRTGDSAPFRALTYKCQACNGFADQVDQIYADGGYIHTKGSTIKSIKKSPEWSATRPVYIAVTDSSPTTYLSSKDGKPDHFQGGITHDSYELVKHGGAWKVTNLEELAS